MEKNMQVVVTGASGFVARNVRKHLSDNNIKLISISRKDFKKFKNETKIITKNYDEKTISSKIKDSDALIHLVGIGKQTIDNDYNLINTEFTKKIVALCKKSKIKKIVYTSGEREPDQVQLLFMAPNWTDPIVRSSFDSLSWSTAAGTLLRRTLGGLIQGIRSGHFFIVPDTYSDGCAFRVACRREHGPTWWRAIRAAEPKILKSFRSLRVKDE